MKTCRTLSVRLLLLTLSFASFGAAADCDDGVKELQTRHLKNTTLCELQDRYKKAIAQLEQAGINNPRHIGNVYAPRFINKLDWTKYLAKNGDSEFAAWRVYNPSPATWGNWAKVAEIIDDPNTPNVFQNGTSVEMKDWVRSLHTLAVGGILYAKAVGKFRSEIEEIIPLHSTDDAYNIDQIQAVVRAPYVSVKGPRKAAPLVTWAPRHCNELPRKSTDTNYYFKMNIDEKAKSCGDLTMAPAKEVDAQMSNWASHIQLGLRDPRKVDILAFVSGIQQWFVMVHPFIDGNGRMSRFMMDFVLNQLQLPLPVLDDMNQDFFSTPEEWAALVGKGMLNTVQALEACVQVPSTLGCKEVSEFPPTAPTDVTAK